MQTHPLIRLVWLVTILAACTPINTAGDSVSEGNKKLEATISANETKIANLESKVNDRLPDPTIAVLETIISHLATAVGSQRELSQRTPPAPTLPIQTSTNIPSIKVYPRETRTMVPEVNDIIDVFLDGDLQSRVGGIKYTQTGCTHADGLGGPPKCAEGVSEGTIVEVFPLSGPEGHYTDSQGIEGVLDFGVTGVYAVYRVPEDAYEAEYWPAGQYVIIFILDEITPNKAIGIVIEDSQIVRLDYIFGDWIAETVFNRAREFILPPLTE